MLELKNICYEVETEKGKKEILKNVNLTIDEHFVAITGPNGGGKSTLAKLIAGIETPVSGEIIYNGTDITNMSITERAQLGISFAFQTNCSLKKRTILKQWITTIVENNKKEVGEISYIFCSDEQLLEINKEFLNHDYYTDIITFDYSEADVISGDLFISIERIKDNAKTLKTSYQEELHRVIIHGVLHLLGYKDKTEVESENMRKLEDECLLILSTYINEK